MSWKPPSAPVQRLSPASSAAMLGSGSRQEDCEKEPHASHWKILRPTALAPWAALLSCVLFCCNGELLQALQVHSSREEGHASPLLNLTICHLGGLMFLPWFACGPRKAGASYCTPAGGGAARSSLASCPRAAALLFALLLMSYNYAWLLSAKYLAAGLTNAVFQVSVAFVYVASVILFAEPANASRLLGVALALLGSLLASGLTENSEHQSPAHTGSDSSHAAAAVAAAAQQRLVGVALALAAAAGYTVYQVLFRFIFGHLKQDASFLAYFGTWISIWHLLVVLPLVLLAHFTGGEQLEFPHAPIAVLGTTVSAVLASTVNALYLCIVMWGSPMLLPATSALSVPFTVLLDFLLHGRPPHKTELLGQTLVLVSVVLILQLHTLTPRHFRKAAKEMDASMNI